MAKKEKKVSGLMYLKEDTLRKRIEYLTKLKEYILEILVKHDIQNKELAEHLGMASSSLSHFLNTSHVSLSEQRLLALESWVQEYRLKG